MFDLTTPRRLLLSAASGLLFFLAFPPVQWHGLGWIALAPLFIAVVGARLRIAALCGLLATIAFYGLSVYWVYSIFRTHGRLSFFQAAGVQSALLLYLSIYRVALCVALAWVSRRCVRAAWIAAPFLWVVMEWLFVRTPHFSLPWNLLGYSATEQPAVLQLASVTGVYGLSFLMAAYAALLAWAALSRGPRMRATPATVALGAFTAVLLIAHFFGARWVPAAEAPFAARLVQANLPLSESFGNDWIDRNAVALDEMERLSLAGGAPHEPPVTSREPRLVIWPEVPAPFYLQDPRFAMRAQRVAVGNGGSFLVGVVEWRAGSVRAETDEPQRLRPRNSAVLLGPTGERLYTYDKIHLVPFGEYVPLREWLRFADSLVAEVGGFVPGTEYAVGATTQGKFATLVCFEAVFPHEVRRFVAAGAELLVNISNDGWLGPTGGPLQHMEMARMRAVENRRWLLRATNNGRTVAVDPYGRIVARLAPGERATLDAPYNFRADQTIYARYGDWFAWLCAFVSGGCVFLSGKGAGK